MSAPTPDQEPPRWARILMPLGILIAGGLMIAYGWDRGADVLIDFGRELYVPWRLLEGDLLHKEIAWFNGPLSPWVNAAWMRIFGVTFDSLQAANVVVIAVSTVLLMHLIRRIADRFTCWVGALVFLLVFAVGQQESVGNFLFLSPYSHGITHGFVCGLVSLAALGRAARDGSLGWTALAGFASGCAFLTKAEMSLAVVGASAVSVAAMCVSAIGRERRSQITAAFLVGMVVPLALAYLRFVAEIGIDKAPLALLGTWPYALDDRASDLKFYKMMRGSDDPALHLRRMALVATLTIVFVGALYAATAQLVRRSELARRCGQPAGFALGLITFCAVVMTCEIKWLIVSLPVALLVLGLMALKKFWSGREELDGERRIRLLGFVTFAGLLLPKVLLLPLARQYGFVLSVPGTMVFVAVLVRWLPDRLSEGRHETEKVRAALRMAGAGVAVGFALMNLNATRGRFATKRAPVGEGADRIIGTGWQTNVMNSLIVDLEGRVGPDETVLVLPEGIIVNYQIRRATPSRVVNFMPPELVFFRPDEIVESLRDHPPAAVALIHRPTDIYGYPFFGEGYGEDVLGWVQDNYERVVLFGDEPLEEGLFGAEIMIPKASL